MNLTVKKENAQKHRQANLKKITVPITDNLFLLADHFPAGTSRK